MRGEIKLIMGLAKKTIDKSIYQKLEHIKDESELKSAAEHALISKLENEEYLLKKKIQYMKNYGKDVFFIENKHLLLDSKIKHFKATFSKEDFIKVQNIINDIKKEILNVQSIKPV
ncbi:MAG TPA: hypothetical protein VHA12_03605 [Candidatus Nanoarchaeia archaeon]|nr:hypothetical protein [Candidatus Nanoarchaeia archaeon]